MSYVLEDLDLIEADVILELRQKFDKSRNLTLGFIKYLNNQE
jgi:hypothetical protein